MNDSEETSTSKTLVLRSDFELVSTELLPIGTIVRVEQTSHVFTAVGNAREEHRALLGWEQANIWLPAPALQTMQRTHPEFPDHVRALAITMREAISIHESNVSPPEVQFFTDAEGLREHGLLTSSTIRYVDALIQLRSGLGGSYLRAFHLSPVRRTKGRQLWP